MDKGLSSADSLLAQAGLLTASRKLSGTSQENVMPEADLLSSRAPSVTDLDADMLGVKLDDCSRYFKNEIMVSKGLCCLTGLQQSVDRPQVHQGVCCTMAALSLNAYCLFHYQGFFLDSKQKLTFEGRALAEAEQLKGASQLATSQARLESVKEELYRERQTSIKTEAILQR